MKRTRILKNIKKSYSWESRLKSANELVHLGPQKFENSVRDYGKILEMLLRFMYKEIILTLSGEEKRRVVEIENEIGKGKAFEKFGFGQMIRFFSKSSLLKDARKLLKTRILQADQLHEVNSFRVDQTHYDEEVTRDKVNEIREYVTNVLLELELIERDPEKVEIEEASKEIGTRQGRIDSLQQIVKKIRLGLMEKSFVEDHQIFDSQEGLYGDIIVEGEIVGVCLRKDETFAVLVKVNRLDTPVNEEERAIEALASEVRTIVESIASETKGKLNILFYDETYQYGSGLESMYASWTSKEGVSFY